jgi:hypothetical protein
MSRAMISSLAAASWRPRIVRRPAARVHTHARVSAQAQWLQAATRARRCPRDRVVRTGQRGQLHSRLKDFRCDLFGWPAGVEWPLTPVPRRRAHALLVGSEMQRVGDRGCGTIVRKLATGVIRHPGCAKVGNGPVSCPCREGDIRLRCCPGRQRRPVRAHS